jgi:hypothetical protein
MILSLAVLHVKYQRDKYKDLLCPLPSHMWWCYTGLPPLPAPAKNVTGKLAHVEWRREQKILALTWQEWGSSTRCITASSS